MLNDIEIGQASRDHVGHLVPLFDAYRQFYKQDSDEAAAQRFLAERLEQRDSVIFLACHGQESVGFAQLYPSFSSVAMRRLWVLNDLFVIPSARRQGVGELLIRRAVEFARTSDACRLVLATGVDNIAAQRLYKKLGWMQDEAFAHFKYAV
jgi:ribosomal protein S18 acetylase RimI-like enzyme